MLTVIGLVSGAHNLGSEWVIRVVVVLSLVTHVLLAVFAGVRRRQAYCLSTLILWLSYQYLDWAAPYVLSNLSIGSTPRELPLVTLWLPCVVAYRAGPDNITAYSLEDIKTSARLCMSAILQIGTILYVVAKQIVAVKGKGALFWASVVMVVVGIAKYGERVRALWDASFGHIRSSGKKKNGEPLRILLPPLGHGKKLLLGNEEALLVAHQVLRITKGAFADFSIDEATLNSNSSLGQIFSRGDTGWENMCRVVDMELSLMYDILYTKLAVIHDWCGYAIRVVSPVVTASVMVLFWIFNKAGQRTADVCITYSLLAVALLLDLRWLLGAAASAWTYAFFNADPARWLHHQVCCTGTWRRLRRFVVSLDPWQLPLRDHGGGYRLWSGNMGQYNLLEEWSRGTTCCWMIKKLSLEDAWMDYNYSGRLHLYRYSSTNVKKLLFEQIQEEFNMAPPPRPKMPRPAEKMPPRRPEAKATPLEAGRHKMHRELDKKMGFLPEFQEAILILHVATDVFLLDTQEKRTQEDHGKYTEAIKAVSDYMAFLAAVRPGMLPGIHLRSMHQATLEALDSLWGKGRSATRDVKELVEILRKQNQGSSEEVRPSLYDFSIVLSDGIVFAELLQKALEHIDWKTTLDETLEEDSNSRKRFLFIIPDLEKRPEPLNMLALLELILRSWVRMLIYVSTRCGSDSHAKRLASGCELTTMVWILSEHTGIFAPKPYGQQ